MRPTVAGITGRKAPAIVADRDRQPVSPGSEVDGHAPRSRVLPHVRERLRGDPERLGLHVRIEPRRLDLRCRDDADGELRGFGDAGGVGAYRGDQPGVRPDRAAQAQDRLADVDVDGSRRRGELAEVGARLVDPAGREEAVDSLGLRADVAEHLREPVVELARDSLPLADDRQLPEARLQPRVLQGDRGLVGE